MTGVALTLDFVEPVRGGVQGESGDEVQVVDEVLRGTTECDCDQVGAADQLLGEDGLEGGHFDEGAGPVGLREEKIVCRSNLCQLQPGERFKLTQNRW